MSKDFVDEVIRPAVNVIGAYQTLRRNVASNPIFQQLSADQAAYNEMVREVQDLQDAEVPQTMASESAIRSVATESDSKISLGQVSGVSRKRGHAKIGPWAARQRDRKAAYNKMKNLKNTVWRIDRPVGLNYLQLPFQIWDQDSFFWELFPNGMPVGSSTGTDVCTYNNQGTLGWGLVQDAFTNTSIFTEQDIYDSATLPRDYTEDELEWPFIRVLMNQLRLICRPGKRSCVCRLLVIQLWDNNHAVPLVDEVVANIKLKNFISNAGTTRSITMPLDNHPKARENGWDFKVLTDKTFVCSPGDSDTHQIPFVLEINQRQGEVELIKSEAQDSSYYRVLGNGRIVWQLFYQDSVQVPSPSPNLTTSTSDLPSYYGSYKMKWQLLDR